MRPLDNEAEYQRILRNGEGFIYNDYAAKGANGGEYNILHRSMCWTLRNSLVSKKYYGDNLEEATAWLIQHQGAEGQNWHRCPECQ